MKVKMWFFYHAPEDKTDEEQRILASIVVNIIDKEYN